MKNLINKLENETVKQIERLSGRFQEEYDENPDKLTSIERNWLNRSTPYKKSRVTQVLNRIDVLCTQELEEKRSKIEAVESATDKLPNDVVITINFYKSRTWGYCPKGNDNYGHVTDSITGCGYCKESTATAELLNQNEMILKRLYQAEKVSYGACMRGLPSFSGGVGVSCHVKILEELGYKVTQSGNDSTTVLIISEK